jgi:hypothetical protein
MKIGDRQQFGLPFGEPFGARCGLAFGTAAITARVVGNDPLAALIAQLHVPAHGRRAAIANVSDGLLLVAGQHVPPLCQEVVCVQTEDADLQRCRLSSLLLRNLFSSDPCLETESLHNS